MSQRPFHFEQEGSVLLDREEEHKFGDDDGGALVRYYGPGRIVQVVQVDDFWVYECGGDRKQVFEVCEEGWVVKCFM